MRSIDIVEVETKIDIAEVETKKQPVVLQRKKKKAPKVYVRDIGLQFTVFVTSIVSFAAAVFYYIHHETLLYNDVYEHLIVSRRVVDSITPGFMQLGAGWLPLQHLLILPFIWNDYLWRTGLAGTIPSMVCYIVAGGYLFCLLRKLTKQLAPAFIGVIIYITNPNILYLQSVPLTETACVATFAVTAYYLLCWLQSYKQKYVVYTAIAICAGTLTRYDGWALFLVVSAIVIAPGVFSKHSRNVILDQIIIYLLIAPLGIIFWFIWNIKLNGDPLYFQRGQYSAQAEQLDFLRKGELPTYHNLLISLHIYSVDTWLTVGWGIFICALIGLALILVLCRKRQEYLILAVMFVPFIFYVITLYAGQSILAIPGVDNGKYFFNVRYGAQMVLPVAFFIARGSALLLSWLKKWPIKIIFVAICLTFVAIQVSEVNASGIISLQDGLIGMSCNNPDVPVILSLDQHYNGGRILVNEGITAINPQLFGAYSRDIIWEGTGPYWKNALAQPAKYVNWVAFNPYAPSDIVAKMFTGNKQKFLSSFKLISSDPHGTQLYYKIGAPPLPTRPVSNQLIDRPHSCKLNG